MRFVAGLSIKEIARRTGRDRDTVRRALRSSAPPRYARAPARSKLDPLEDEIHWLLRDSPKLPGQRVRELIAPLGFDGPSMRGPHAGLPDPSATRPIRTLRPARPGSGRGTEVFQQRAGVNGYLGPPCMAVVRAACAGLSSSSSTVVEQTRRVPCRRCHR